MSVKEPSYNPHSITFQKESVSMRNNLPKSLIKMNNLKPIGTLYVHPNDPKQTRKGVNITNFKHIEGGYLPLLTDTDYNERKYNKLGYNYNTKLDHGSRAMHRSTLNLTHGTTKNDYVTRNRIDFKGYQLNPEYIPTTAGGQFKSQFDLGENNYQRSLTTTYNNHFYSKNEDKMYQLQRDNRVKEYGNSSSTIKETMTPDRSEPNYWTQYNRTHGLLAAKLGPGEPRNYPDRSGYNILTGEESKLPVWTASHNYNKVSGNVVLESSRSKSRNIID